MAQYEPASSGRYPLPTPNTSKKRLFRHCFPHIEESLSLIPPDAIANTATVSLQSVGDTVYGTMDLEPGINETLANLSIGGVLQPAGTYGNTASSATHKLDQYFTGPGILTVTKK